MIKLTPTDRAFFGGLSLIIAALLLGVAGPLFYFSVSSLFTGGLEEMGLTLLRLVVSSLLLALCAFLVVKGFKNYARGEREAEQESQQAVASSTAKS